MFCKLNYGIQTTQPAYNLRPLWAHQRNAIQMAFCRMTKKSDPIFTWADPENSVRGSGGKDKIVFLFFFYSHQSISQRAVRASLEKQLDPRGPIASSGGGGGLYQYF